MDGDLIHSNEAIGFNFCGEEGAEPKGKALDLLLHLHFNL